jgi:hypothetical protein
MKSILTWIKQSFEENGKTSSKRTTLFAVVIMLGIVVISYTDVSNSVEMALVLSGLIGSLVGITVYGVVKQKNTPSSDEV